MCKSACMWLDVNIVRHEIVSHCVFNRGPWFFACNLEAKKKDWCLSLCADD